MLKKILLLICICIGCFFAVILLIKHNGYSDFRKLTTKAGKNKGIEKLTFIGQGKYEVLEDPKSLQFVKDELSNGTLTEHLTDGYSFHGEIIFSTFSKLELDYSISKTEDELIIGYEESSGFYCYYLVRIASNAPKGLVDLLSILTEPKN